MELIPQGEKAIVDFEVRSRDEVKSGIPVYPNDLLIAKITPCFENGKIGFVPNKFGSFIATTEVYPIRPKGKIDMKFLFYFLKLSEIREHLKNQMTGSSGRKRVPKGALLSLPIPLPPLPEQKRIVEILSLAEDLIKKQKGAIALIDKILMAKFLEMFGDPATNPKGWEVRRLGEVVDISPAKYKLWTKKVFFIPMELIPQGEKVFTDFQIKDIDEVKSGTPVYPNDLLLAKITPCFENGKIGFVPPRDGCFIATTEVHPIRPKRKIDLRFLFFFLKHPRIKEYLKNNMTGTSGRKRVPKNALKNLLIPLPPHRTPKRVCPNR